MCLWSLAPAPFIVCVCVGTQVFVYAHMYSVSVRVSVWACVHVCVLGICDGVCYAGLRVDRAGAPGLVQAVGFVGRSPP